jgi:hypothetical protein
MYLITTRLSAQLIDINYYFALLSSKSKYKILNRTYFVRTRENRKKKSIERPQMLILLYFIFSGQDIIFHFMINKEFN